MVNTKQGYKNTNIKSSYDPIKSWTKNKKNNTKLWDLGSCWEMHCQLLYQTFTSHLHFPATYFCFQLLYHTFTTLTCIICFHLISKSLKKKKNLYSILPIQPKKSSLKEKLIEFRKWLFDNLKDGLKEVQIIGGETGKKKKEWESGKHICFFSEKYKNAQKKKKIRQ